MFLFFRISFWQPLINYVDRHTCKAFFATIGLFIAIRVGVYALAQRHFDGGCLQRLCWRSGVK